MKKSSGFAVPRLFFTSCSILYSATNGDNLIGIGPISRGMGGVGIAAPQDAISGVFANPAAMCLSPYCPGAEFNFAGTLFAPAVDGSIAPMPGGADSDDKAFAIPAIGLSVPLSEEMPFWRFGLAAYGVSGLGVDYRDTKLAPAHSARSSRSRDFTQLQIMKFAPALAYQPTDKLSLGVGVHIDYASLDLGAGPSFNYALGVQLGVIYQPMTVRLGVTYVSPQKVSHENVYGSGRRRDWTISTSKRPSSLGWARRTTFGKRLLDEPTPSGSTGPTPTATRTSTGGPGGPRPRRAVRAASRPVPAGRYNFGKNPVEEHDGLSRSQPDPVQGKSLPTYYYETFRVIGFPAIVEQHLTFGLGYGFTRISRCMWATCTPSRKRSARSAPTSRASR